MFLLSCCQSPKVSKVFRSLIKQRFLNKSTEICNTDKLRLGSPRLPANNYDDIQAALDKNL